MQKSEFKDQLKIIGITQKEFAQLIDYSYSSVKGWKKTPKWADIVLSHMRLIQDFQKLDEDIILMGKIREEIHIMSSNIGGQLEK